MAAHHRLLEISLIFGKRRDFLATVQLLVGPPLEAARRSWM